MRSAVRVLLAVAALGDVVACTPAPIAVQIPFAAVVGAAPFACGQSYDGIGTSSSTITFGDLRFYVSDVVLVTRTGDVPLTLDVQAPWQQQRVALLDFEDGTGACTGTHDTRTVITGTAPIASRDDVTGVRFDVRVPDDLNHADPAKAIAPLNESAMFWSWEAGYRFFKLDLNSTGSPTGWYTHVGSADCSLAAGGVGTVCSHENAATISLHGLSTIQLDVKALLAGADVDENTADTAPGCMSEPTDPDCVPLFHALGLSLTTETAPIQSAFSMQPSKRL